MSNENPVVVMETEEEVIVDEKKGKIRTFIDEKIVPHKDKIIKVGLGVGAALVAGLGIKKLVDSTPDYEDSYLYGSDYSDDYEDSFDSDDSDESDQEDGSETESED